MFSARALAVAAALTSACPVARASTSAGAAGYLISADRRPVADSFGACWHTREWRPGMRFASCEPKLAKTTGPVAASTGTVRAAPVPGPVAEAAKPAPKRPAPLRLSAGTLFEFDSVALTAKGRAALDALDRQIAGADYRYVDVSGHADPLGTASYNRILSARRAEAVRDYLAGHGIDAHRIRTQGLGSEDAVTSGAQCQGLQRAGLIRCLQPDRYAEIAVVGAARTASAQ